LESREKFFFGAVAKILPYAAGLISTQILPFTFPHRRAPVVILPAPGGYMRTHPLQLVLPVLAVLAAMPAQTQQKAPPVGRPDSQAASQSRSSLPSSKSALIGQYGKLPLSFEANQGQVNSQVRFVSRGEGYSLFLTDREAVLALRKPGNSQSASMGDSRPGARSNVNAGLIKTDVVRMQLAGASPDLRVNGSEPLSGKANYFIGSDPSQWHTNVPTFSRVKYSGVYPGVDLIYYGNRRQLEYDFVVAPNADPGQIRLRFDGAKKLALDPGGNLEIITKNGQIAFQKPVAYQQKDGTRQSVRGRFRLLAGKSVGFEIGEYDRTMPLVIDPTLSYSTYLGGSNGATYGTAIAVDSSGDAYVTGVVYASNFPATSGAYQTLNHSSATTFDAFVAKLNSTGTALVYATYLGGSGNTSVAGTLNHGDYPTGINIDSSDEAYVTGIAYSVDFPVTTGVVQSTNKGGANGVSNCFVTRIDAAGSGLVYSTYLGGSGLSGYAGKASLGDTGGDGCASIAIDSSEDAYLTGTAYSTNFPVTSGVYQATNKGASAGRPNAFVAKLNPQGTTLDFATYLGGSNGDGGSGIALDADGDAYIDGATYSTDFPVTSGVLQSTNHTSAAIGSNGFVSKLNSTGSSLAYSTYLGGSGNANGPSGNNNGDAALSIALDSSNDAYVFGLTSSGDFPVTSGALQSVNSAFATSTGANFFIAKVDPTAAGLVYATYLGGSGGDFSPGSSGMALDSDGDVYLTGYAMGTDFPLSSNAYQSSPACALATDESVSEFESPVFSEINPSGTALLYSTYFGGTGHVIESTSLSSVSTCDEGYGLALDSENNAYLTGSAASANFPTTTGAYQSTNPANGSAFISKFLMNAATTTTATTTSITSSVNPAAVGTSLMFTATVRLSGGAGVPAGTLTFSVDGGAGTAVTLNGSGQASYSTSTLTAGTHSIAASYSGSTGYTASSDSFTETIFGPAANIAVVSGSGQSATVGSAFPAPLMAVVKDANGTPVSGASVNFTGTSLSFSSSTVTTGSGGTASTTVTPTAAGTLTATASTTGVSASAAFTLTATASIGTAGSGIISTYAGDGTKGYSGDGGASTSAELAYPVGAAMDKAGNLYIADLTNNRIRKVTPAGVISTYAGDGTAGFSGDGGPATNAKLNGPLGIGLDNAGNLYIGDSYNQRVRRVTPEGVISTFAGTGTQGYNGDGIAATSAELYYPAAIIADSNGNIFISDYFNNRIREVNTLGIISTVAGDGTNGFSGDGGPATSAELYYPNGVALDSAGNLFIADYYNNRVRKVTTAGIISTFAGTGVGGYNGDGIAATSAELWAPNGLATDSAGNVYIGDYANNRARKVDTAGIISTVAGDGIAGFSGDGGLATSAELTNPQGLAVDPYGSLYIADSNNNRIRKVQYQTDPAAFSPGPGTYTSAQTVTITDGNAGAAIYYTTDGSTPTTLSTEYTTPITVSTSETLTAIATSSKYNNSAPTSAAYVVNITPASVTLVSGSGQMTPYGSAFANPLVVVVKDTNGNPIPGEVVSFTGAGLSFSSTTATTASNGEASVTATALAVGNLIASASTSGVTGTVSFSLAATKAALTVTATNASVAYNQPIPALKYSVTGFVNGDTSSVLSGSPMESTTATQGSAVGTYPVTIAAGTLSAANYTFTFVNGSLTINSLGTVAAPTFLPVAGTYTSAQNVTIGDTTFGATIYYSIGNSTPTSGSTKYTAAIPVNATETIEAIAVAPGYANSAVATAAYVITISPPSFTLASSPASATISADQSAKITLTITPANGFTQSVSFTCSGLPTGDKCSFSPSTVAPAGAPVNSALTISSTASAAASRSFPWKRAGAGLAMALLLWPTGRRRNLYRLAMLLLLFGAFALAGCGGSLKANNYTVTITATGGGVTQMSSVDLTVTQ
jgi:sugar lactone lactonase YvrE